MRGEQGFCRGDVDVVNQIEGERFDFFEVVVVRQQAGELGLSPVEPVGSGTGVI